MKRRSFLILAGLGLVGNLYGCLTRLTQPAAVRPPEPSPTPSPTRTPAPTRTPFQPRPTATVALPTSTVEPATLTATAIPQKSDLVQPADDLVADDFSSPTIPPSLAVLADSAGQVSVADGRLLVRGVAPGENDPAVFDRTPIPRVDGQAAGARFKVAFGRQTGRIGLASTEGQVFAGIHRTAAEGLGGILECGGAVYPVLSLYSGCWYDFVIFLQSGQTAFAINDGAGLELVLVSEADGTTPGNLGYWAAGGEDQDASLDAWYATGQRFFPEELISEGSPPPDFEADMATNAAWVEARVTRSAGQAGLRIRSIDHDNEYRVYLDGTQLIVDQVVDGISSSIATQSLSDTPGAALAVRYNELTLTVYYDGQATKIVNRKIGASVLVAGTKIGLYSTDPGNQFTNFRARAVRLQVPGDLAGRLQQSRQVLCLGDSLTNGDKAFGYQNLLRKSLGDNWVTIDCGVNSQTTYQMLLRLPGHLRRYSPEVLVVLGGTNDIVRYPTGAAVKANLQEIYRTAKQAGVRVVAVTIPPCAKSKGWTDAKQALLENINAWIMGAGYVDYRVDAYHMLKDPNGDALRPAYDGGDHIHLSGSGYNALANAIFRSVAW